MMFNKLAILAIGATLAEIASAAVGRARVVNNCRFPVTLYSVGSDISAPKTIAKNGGTYSEPFHVDPKSGGIALKIVDTPEALYDGSPQTVYSYSLKGNSIWYDLSTVFGANLKNHRLVVSSANTACPKIDWKTGTPPAGSQVKTCNSDKDVTLLICAPQ